MLRGAPFQSLLSRRVPDTNLPGDLQEFYSCNEGCGKQVEPRSIRLCKHEDLRIVSWNDLHVLGGDPIPDGWQNFRAILIGVGAFFEEYLYVLESGVFKKGSILAMGISVIGPGGTGRYIIEPSLLLAKSFSEWLSSLERCNWIEVGLHSGEVNGKAAQMRMNDLKAMNPHWNELE